MSLFIISFTSSDLVSNSAPQNTSQGATITILVFNVTNLSSTGNNLTNITINLIGSASAGNLTNITLSNGSKVWYNDSFLSNATSISIDLFNTTITEPTNFTLNFTLSSSAKFNLTIGANITEIGNESNITYSELPYVSNLTLIWDFILPTPDLSKESSTRTTLTIDRNCSDLGGSGIVNNKGTIDWEPDDGDFDEGDNKFTGLDCGTEYEITLTCKDVAGNLKSKKNKMSTSDCESHSSGEGASSSNLDNASLYLEDSQELRSKGSFSKILKKNDKVKLKINNTAHYVKIINITNNSTTIEVSSTPQIAILKIWETKKFEVTGDIFYDLSVTLNSINSTKANITIAPSLEKIYNNVTTKSNSVSSSNTKSPNNLVRLWIPLILTLVGIIILIWIIRRNKNFNDSH